MSNELIGVSNNNIVNIFRSAGTKRWTIIPMVRQQTLAEHHCLVASIAIHLMSQMDEVDDLLFSYAVVKKALDHDLQEVVTGDLPTPGKKALGHSIGAVICYAEEDIRRDMGILDVNLGETDKIMRDQILKAADNLEAMWFAATNIQCGVGLKALEDIVSRTATISESWPYSLKAAARDVVANIITMTINDKVENLLMSLHATMGEK